MIGFLNPFWRSFPFNRPIYNCYNPYIWSFFICMIFCTFNSISFALHLYVSWGFSILESPMYWMVHTHTYLFPLFLLVFTFEFCHNPKMKWFFHPVIGKGFNTLSFSFPVLPLPLPPPHTGMGKHMSLFLYISPPPHPHRLFYHWSFAMVT